ncbi:MAG TPA: hypothetical protein VLL52_02215 [Anaerolineae bacterium]|nr:hypothetical protein [Anaerolineae bacterium]
MASVQYITNEDGKQVGVLLDINTYKQLMDAQVDADLLVGLNREELLALAETQLTTIKQELLSTLLEKNKLGSILEEELEELDHLLAHIDQLNILKARAKYTLGYLEQLAEAS